MNNYFATVGNDNFIAINKVTAIFKTESLSTKKKIRKLKEIGVLLDATCGKKARSLIFLEDGSAVLSMMNPETISKRLTVKK